MTWEDQFIADYKNLSEEDFFYKYYDNISAYVSNAGFVSRVLEINASSIFIDETWYGDYRDPRTFFLLSSANGEYEVFRSERGGKHHRTVHTNLKDALETKIDLVLHALGHKASDAKIYPF